MSVLSLSLLVWFGAAQVSRNVELQLTSLDAPVSDIQYCGDDYNSVLILTEKNSLYRSNDSGLTWTRLTDQLERESAGAVTGKKATGLVDRIVLSKADPSYIALLGLKGLVWFSSDCAKTFKAVNHGRPINEFQLHPKVKNWALSASWDECSDFQTSICKTNKSLFITRNSGVDWVKLADYVVQFSWAQDGLDSDLQERIPKERILASRIREDSQGQKLTGWSQGIDLLKTDDYFRTTTVLVPRGNKFLLANRYILVAQVIEEESDDIQLLVSNERNLERFYKADLPIKRIPDHSYTLLDSSEGSLLLNINHYGSSATYGNIYTSDSTGRRFSLSMLHNIRNPNGISDVVKLESLEGIFIANYFDKEFTSKDLQQTKSVNKKTSSNNNPPERSYIKTAVSYDKGGEWKPLTPPERDCEGKRVVCPDEDCSLHLHLLTYDRFAPAYSTESSVGLFLAVGNVGYSLSHSPEELNTYLSRDGGLEWFEVKKGSNIYEIGDHGAIIVIANDQSPTDTLYYSWNEGLTWESLKFSSSPVKVDNILVKPGSTSQKFVLFGTQKSKGFVVSLDFSSLHEPQCRSPERAGTDSSDYELWSPNDGRAGSRCLMGRHVTYIRRKREAECYNGEDFEAITDVKDCECTTADYECDVGFYRDRVGSCIRVDTYELPPETCEDDDIFYEAITGYRRIPGNTCVGGVSRSFEPLRILCTSDDWPFNWLQLLAFLALCIGAFFAYKHRDFLKEKLEILRKPKDYSREGFTQDLGRAPDMPDDDMFDRDAESLGEKLQDFDPRI